MSHVWACICCLFVFVSFMFLSHFYLFLFHCLPVLCPEHHLQCLHRRGFKTHCTHAQWRSIPPWRYTILSHTGSTHGSSPWSLRRYNPAREAVKKAKKGDVSVLGQFQNLRIVSQFATWHWTDSSVANSALRKSEFVPADKLIRKLNYVLLGTLIMRLTNNTVQENSLNTCGTKRKKTWIDATDSKSGYLPWQDLRVC